MAKTKEHMAAQKLRRQGMSIKSIAKKLAVSRGSASVWCRDVELTSQQRKYLREAQISAGHKGRMMGAESNRRKKEINIAEQRLRAKEIVGSLSQRDRLMLGIGLYWGEGVKTDASATAMVNSDADIIIFAKDWFMKLGVSENDFRPYVYISETHKSREEEILAYWSNKLEIPLRQFHKVIFLKGRRKKLYENHQLYYGIVSLRVRKGTSLKYRIRGLIECCTSRRSSGS